MTIEKEKYLKILKLIDQANIVLALALACIHPYFPVYDEAGKLNETSALARIAIIIAVVFVVVPIFRKEITLIQKNKKPFDLRKNKQNIIHMPKVNFFVAIIFAICPLVFMPLAFMRYADYGLQWQAFYAVFYLFVYVGIGSRLQLKMALRS